MNSVVFILGFYFVNR